MPQTETSYSRGNGTKRQSTPVLCSVFMTCGYQRFEIESFLKTLRKRQVELVVDIRQNPVSRKPGFSKACLAAHLSKTGIQYLHFACLGTPPHIRKAYCRHGRIDQALRQYERYLESKVSCLEALIEQVSNVSFCLLCLEDDYNACHRSVVARKLAEMTGWSPKHLT